MFTTDEIIDAIRTGYIPPDPGRLGEFGRVLEALGERRSTEAVAVHPKVLTAAEVAEIRARAEKATPGPLSYDGYNTITDAQRRCIASIPDHPTDDESFAPEQIQLRGAWYTESANNANLFAHANVDVNALCGTIEALRADWDRVLKLTRRMEHEAKCAASMCNVCGTNLDSHHGFAGQLKTAQCSAEDRLRQIKQIGSERDDLRAQLAAAQKCVQELEDELERHATGRVNQRKELAAAQVERDKEKARADSRYDQMMAIHNAISGGEFDGGGPSEYVGIVLSMKSRISELEQASEARGQEVGRLRKALVAETICPTCEGAGIMGGPCEACEEVGYPVPGCGYCHGTGKWESTCAECEGDKRSFRSDAAKAALADPAATPAVEHPDTVRLNFIIQQSNYTENEWLCESTWDKLPGDSQDILLEVRAAIDAARSAEAKEPGE